MPRTKSALKALHVSEKKRKHNLEIKKKFKSAIKSFRKQKKGDLKTLSSILDKAAAKNVIHKNKAARLKSRLSKTVEIKKVTKTKVKSKNKKK
ncbi:MAG: 30S ribosomal protein S20 [Candidatus Berkelbacteria bacterium]|nr:30S ribosomal protein S20 [Candidatus Berkelbacteria bacterium]